MRSSGHHTEHDGSAGANVPSMHDGMARHEWAEELIAVIGITALIALAEHFGGTRKYIPARYKPGHPIVAAIGIEAATALAKTYAPDQIIVPLAIQLRAVHYREQGYSNARIATRLCRSEKGVEKIFRDLRAQGVSIIKPRNAVSIDPPEDKI